MTEDVNTIVIFGGTGDLSRRKLVPALFNLERKGRLPRRLNIVGFSRNGCTTDEFRQMLREGARDLAGLDVPDDLWEEFAEHVHYVSGDLTSREDLVHLQEKLGDLEGGAATANRLFYLSVAPGLYGPAVEHLGASGLVAEDSGWRRLVIEKPFGHDLESAKALNQKVHKVFGENQVFRIDHYLGKETVQNLIVFRFANAIFEPLWNRNYIDNVQITVAENVLVGDRGGYYDQSGAVRDMMQNHLLQLLALVAMEPPSAADEESLRDRKADVLKAVRRYSPEDAARNGVRGQYEGYLQEQGVGPNSVTPTYVAVRLFVDNWRWQGVPFYLRTGKGLDRKASEIVIQFRYPPHLAFALGECEDLQHNLLGLCIQPDEGVHLRFETKVPDLDACLRAVNMEFHYAAEFGGHGIPEAYERLLEDALHGNTRLFIRSDQIEQSWQIVEPFLAAWETTGGALPDTYAPHTRGPAAAGRLLADEARTWHSVCGGHVSLDE